MDCHILHSILVVIILLFTIDFIYYHYVKYRSKQKKKKTHCRTYKNIEVENNECKNVRIKNRMCYYFDDKIKCEDFDFDNI